MKKFKRSKKFKEYDKQRGANEDHERETGRDFESGNERLWDIKRDIQRQEKYEKKLSISTVVKLDRGRLSEMCKQANREIERERKRLREKKVEREKDNIKGDEIEGNQMNGKKERAREIEREKRKSRRQKVKKQRKKYSERKRKEKGSQRKINKD